MIIILKTEDKRRKTFRQKQLRYFGFLDPCPSIVGNVSPLKLYDVFKEQYLHALKSILYLFMPICFLCFYQFLLKTYPLVAETWQNHLLSDYPATEFPQSFIQESLIILRKI